MNDDHGFKVNDRRGTAGPKLSSKESSAALGDSTQITFASFVLSISTSAMVHLGVTVNPLSNAQEEDLSLAQQEIHIIEILKEKTVGNLTSDEQKLMDDLLFHLRMLFVEKTKKSS